LHQPNFRTEIKEYLENLLKTTIKLEYIGPINKEEATSEDLKEFGYGKNLLIEFKVNGELRSYILSTMNKNTFGHYFFYDRAKTLLLAHACYNKLPRHVRSIDVGAFTGERKFKSAGNCKEFFILREKVEGNLYYQDLDKIKETKKISELDRKRIITLAKYLAQIHSKKSDKGSLYVRRIRELVGHGECIMGLTDSYPMDVEFTTQKELESIEKKCIEWRYKIKNKKERLCQVHGDFHPWNILFREGIDFSVIDRSRGEWGEAADDVTSITINYLFYAIQYDNKIRENFITLFKLFWDTYLEETNDYDMLSLVAPFYAWRNLVIASPIWYPDLEDHVRRKIFDFILNVLSQDKFNLDSIFEMFE
jgi:hypothetical protein